MRKNPAAAGSLAVSEAECCWADPPHPLFLDKKELHVWRLSLTRTRKDLERLQETLSAAERAHCARFVKTEDGWRCIAARSALRAILASYLRKSPRALSIVKTPAGKPLLVGPDSWFSDSVRGIHFSLTYAEDQACIAVCRGLRVGVDLERVRDVKGMAAIARGFLCQEERSLILSRAGTERMQAFFLVWTRREAASKALGVGLYDSCARYSLPAAQFSPGGFKIVLDTAGWSSAPAGSWWIRDLNPGEGLSGALCIEKKNVDPSYFTLREW